VWNRTRNHDITYTYVSSVYIYMYTHMGFIINIYISPTDLWWPMIWGFNVGIYIYTVYVCIYIYTWDIKHTKLYGLYSECLNYGFFESGDLFHYKDCVSTFPKNSAKMITWPPFHPMRCEQLTLTQD
jgi:hypothetical protein